MLREIQLTFNFLELPMFKDYSKISLDGLVIQVNFDKDDGHNVVDVAGELANLTKSKLKELSNNAKDLAEPALAYLPTYPYVQVLGMSKIGYIDTIKIDNTGLWVKFNDVEKVNEWIDDFSVFSANLLRVIKLKTITRIGVLKKYKTEKDNFENGKIFLNQKFEYVKSTFELQPTCDADNLVNIRLTLEKTDDLCKLDWDIGLKKNVEPRDYPTELKGIVARESLDMPNFLKDC